MAAPIIVTRSPLTLAPTGGFTYYTNIETLIHHGGLATPDRTGTTVNDDFTLSAAVWFVNGVPNIRAVQEEGLVSNKPRKEAEYYTQRKLYLGMSLLMSLGKEFTDANRSALRKRWVACLSGLNITDTIEEPTDNFVFTCVRRFQKTIMSLPDLREAIVQRALTYVFTGSEAHVISQVKMVWENSGYKAVLFMNAFIDAKSTVLEIEAVLDQAIALKTALAQARTSPDFVYSRVKNPNAHPELNHKGYNHLYIAAIAYARQTKAVGENFKASQSITSEHQVLIQRYLREDDRFDIADPSESVLQKLAVIGCTPRNRRRRREDNDSDEEEGGPRRRRRR